jgi:hypothetical protein
LLLRLAAHPLPLKEKNRSHSAKNLRKSGGFFCYQLPNSILILRFAIDYFHLMPVIRKLSAAIEANHVRTSEGGGRVSTLTGLGRKRKAQITVPTTK